MKIQKSIILGIETSCDETSVAIVKNGREVLACKIASSIPLHQETKGVVPEVAARAQIEYMIPVLDSALQKANISWEHIDLISVTQEPGLIGSLLVGISTANILSLIHNIPIVGVPHIWGHMYANLLDNNDTISFPALVLTVSGGHNDLYLWKSHGEFKKLGETLDDASGEAFDKCGRLLGLPYPAGPEVSKLAENGNPNAYNLPRPMLSSDNYHFSFSGLKTAFLYMLEKIKKPFDKKTSSDLAASLQEAICETLWKKTEKALKEFHVKEVHLSGGVSANNRLRQLFKDKLKDKKVDFKYPKNTLYCTDNAAMI
ncbi:tRNA (adenosine(37)-N6)-threonylcarbamoyltransferase complex transferase subunit TsaD, partial [Candidatus Peregrinibacteria bacterium]|nr:tRNA (adenosine(37)-N6)-threonylcarbamoyltransferase complex transferase subunit TsaD [Candidatus Peregrinibacteria bacterium]